MKVTEAKRSYYEKHVLGWQSSGLSQEEYCRQHGVVYNSFKNWRAYLGQSKPKASRFVEAKIAKVEKKHLNEATQEIENAVILQISLANGSRIGVSAKASSVVIEQVLKVAGGLL